MYEFRITRISGKKNNRTGNGRKDTGRLQGRSEASIPKKIYATLGLIALLSVGTLLPAEDIGDAGFAQEYERSRAISQMLADRRDRSGDSAIGDKVEGSGRGGNPTEKPKVSGGAKQEGPGSKPRIVPKPTPGKNVPNPKPKSSLAQDRNIPKSEYVAADRKLALIKPILQKAAGVDVPNGKLRDPLPLPTGEMCELKPTLDKKGKVIDQWKVDNSRKFWKKMMDLGWNQQDRVRALMTFTMEGSFDPKARGDHDNGGSGGMCGLHFKWQKPFLVAEGVMTPAGKLLPKFDDINWQFGACASRYAGGTKFYGYRDALHMEDQWNGKRMVPGKRTKAKRTLARITCK